MIHGRVFCPHNLKALDPRIGVGLGVVDVKDVHLDCGMWMLPRSAANGKLRSLVAGRNLFHGSFSGQTAASVPNGPIRGGATDRLW
jgi:hypothetical protein